MSGVTGTWDMSPTARADIKRSLEYAADVIRQATKGHQEPLVIVTTPREVAAFWLLFKFKPEAAGDDDLALRFVKSGHWVERLTKAPKTAEGAAQAMNEAFAEYKRGAA